MKILIYGAGVIGSLYAALFAEAGYDKVKEPDLAKCAKRKDFGQGFYLTTSKEQAIRKQTISASDSCCPIN